MKKYLNYFHAAFDCIWISKVFVSSGWSTINIFWNLKKKYVRNERQKQNENLCEHTQLQFTIPINDLSTQQFDTQGHPMPIFMCELFDCSRPLSLSLPFSACRSFTHPWQRVTMCMCKTQCFDEKNNLPNLVFFAQVIIVECHTHTYTQHSNYTHPWMQEQKKIPFYAITMHILRDFHS